MIQIKRRRIVFVIGNLLLGGAEKMLSRFLVCLDREKFDPIVLSLGSSTEIESEIRNLSVPVFKFNLKFKGYDLFGIIRFIKKLYQLQPDLIQGWMYYGNVAAQLGKLFLRKQTAIVWGVRGAAHSFQNVNTSTAFFIKLLAKLSKYPNKIIYNSKASAIQHEALGYRTDKRIVIPNGFDAEKFEPNQKFRQEIREELKIPREAFIVGFVTRNHPVKDHRTFIEAASKIIKKHSHVYFVMVGGEITSSNKSLVDFCNERQLKKNVFLLGQREDVPHVTASFDIAVSSSVSEAFPNVIGEAMSSEVPCVVTDVGDSAFLVDDTGIVVPPRDSAALAQAIEKMIVMPENERIDLGKRARERVLKFFTTETCVKRYEAIYEAIFSNE